MNILVKDERLWLGLNRATNTEKMYILYSSDVCFEGFEEKLRLGDTVIAWLFKWAVA